MKKFMQWKLAALATLVLVLGGISNVCAVEMGFYSAGFVVPRAIHNNCDIDTVVGITSTCTGTVYWALFNQNSENVMDGSFPMTCNDLYGFSLNNEVGDNLIDAECYLVFAFGGDDTEPCNECKHGSDPPPDGACNCEHGDGLCWEDSSLAANAFLVNTSDNDVIYVPVLPLDCNDFEENVDLSLMNRDSIRWAENGMEGGNCVHIRYWTDPAFCASTQMVVWTTGNDQKNEHIKIFNDEEERKSITMCWRYKELNLFDPTDKGMSAVDDCVRGKYGSAAAFSAWPSDYIDGFIKIVMPADGIAYSYVTSTYFGAAQTLLGAEFECEEENAGTPPCVVD